MGTSYIFLGCILTMVALLTVTKRNQTRPVTAEATA
jgi:hypothetical protein